MIVGLLGGSFDPVHAGHVRIARAALAAGLSRVMLVPARQPPHKTGATMTDPFHRFALAALATAGEPSLGVSSYEVLREEPSFTINTVRHFRSAGTQVALIMGTDSLVEIETWRDCGELLYSAGVLAYPRRPFDEDAIAKRLPDWIRSRISTDAPGRAGTVGILKGPPDEVSSTIIRDRIRRNLSVNDLVPPAVEEYIHKNGLYAGRPEGDEA